MLQQRKQSKMPASYDKIAELKKMWEKIRLKRMSKSDRQSLVQKSIATLADGDLHDLIFKHDASRVVQSLLKYADVKTDRPRLLKELEPHFVQMAQSAYGRFVVLKALKYAPNAQWRSRIVQAFMDSPSNKVKMTKLIKHKQAALVVDTIYCLYANAKERQLMIEYYYGPEFLILQQSASALEATAEKKSQNNSGKRISLEMVLQRFPEKRERILTQMKDRLLTLVGKEGTVGQNEILHR